MFFMMKVFAFAAVLLIGTIYIAPALTKTNTDSEVGDIAQFRMEIPERAVKAGRGEFDIGIIQTLADINSGRTDISTDTLRNIAGKDPEELAKIVQAGLGGDVTQQTKMAIGLAVNKAREMIKDDGFFVKPGHTKPRD